MTDRFTSHSGAVPAARGWLWACSVALFAAASCGGDDDPQWAPRMGNGTAPESAHARPPSSAEDPDDPTGSGSGSSGTVGNIDTSNVPSFDPGSASDRPLDSLTDSEIDALCERAKNYFTRTVSLDEYERALCYDYSGAEYEENVGDCIDAVDSCLVSISFDYLDCSVNNLKGEGDTCSATIDDYAGCAEEDLAYYKAAVDYWDCKRSKDEPLPQQLAGYPAACVKLFNNCLSL